MGSISHALFGGAAERRQQLPTTVAGFRTLLGWGTTTTAGPRVSESSALNHSTVYACVGILSRTIAAMPTHVIESDGAARRVVPGHPLARVLGREANARQTSFDALQFLAASLFLRGNALALVVRDHRGEVHSIHPLRWDRIRVELRGDEPVYIWTPPAGEARAFDRADVWHIHGLSSDGVVGISPISAQREAIGMGLAMQEYGARFFQAGASPSGVLLHPGTLGGDAEERSGALSRLRTSWEQSYSGLENSHRVAILEEGMKWESIGVAPRDAEFLEGRKFNRAEIAGWFGVPLHLIGDHERGDFSIDTLSQEFVYYHLLPWLRNLEQSISRDLIPAAQRGVLQVKFNVDGLLRGKATERAQFYASGISSGWLAPNEARAKEELDPLPGGETLLRPLNMGVLAGDADAQHPDARAAAESRADVSSASAPAPAGEKSGVADPGERRRLADHFVPSVEDLVRRIGKGEARDLRKLIATHFPGEERAAVDTAEDRQFGGAADGFLRALEAFYAADGSFRAWLLARAKPVLEALQRASFDAAAGELSEETDLEKLEEFFGSLVDSFAAAYSLSSLKTLEAAVAAAPESPAAAALASISLWGEVRAERVAHRATRDIANAAAKEAWRRSGVTQIRWRASGDTCAFCSRLDGRVVGIKGGTFVGKGENWEGGEGDKPLKPRRKITHPPLHRGCDCQIIPAG